MKQYLDAVRNIHFNGQVVGDRTGNGCKSLFALQMRFDLTKGFPLVTAKHTPIGVIIKELLWIIAGDNNVQNLIDQNVHIWDEWRALEEHITDPSEYVERILGKDIDMSIDYKIAKDQLMLNVNTVGPLYGPLMRNAPGGGDTTVMQARFGEDYIKIMKQNLASDKLAKVLAKYPEEGPEQEEAILRQYARIDQIQNLILGLKEKPFSRRHIVSCWFPEVLPDETLKPWDNVLLGRQALAACHCFFQCYVLNPKKPGGKRRLSLQLYQRSADFPLGVPFNIASYALFLMMIAQCCDMEPFELIWTGGDCHYYLNQTEGVKELIERQEGELSTMTLNPDVKDIFQFKFEDFKLTDYVSQPKINFQVAV